MQLKTILNRMQKFKSFVYENVRWEERWLERLCLIVTVVARANSRPICSGCEKTGPGYDTMKARRFEFVPYGIFPCSLNTRCAVWIAGAAGSEWRRFHGRRASTR